MTVSCKVDITADSNIALSAAIANINISVIIGIVALYKDVVSACITESGNHFCGSLHIKLRIFICMYISGRIIILIGITVFNFTDTVTVAVNMICRTCSIFDLGSVSLSS